jgi:hypothetical protein
MTRVFDYMYEWSLNAVNTHLMPQLGDFAVLEVEEGSEDPDVALDGVFNESWKLQ